MTQGHVVMETAVNVEPVGVGELAFVAVGRQQPLPWWAPPRMISSDLRSLALATFELLYESASIDVCEWVLPPVRVVVDRG